MKKANIFQSAKKQPLLLLLFCHYSVFAALTLNSFHKQNILADMHFANTQTNEIHFHFHLYILLACLA